MAYKRAKDPFINELLRGRVIGTRCKNKECPSFKNCSNIPIEVVGDGPVELLFIGGPATTHEEEIGRPFSNRNGTTLRNIVYRLQKEHRKRITYALAHVTRNAEETKRSRSEVSNEAEYCYESFLEKKILELNPKVIVLLGRDAIDIVLKARVNIDSYRGRFEPVKIGDKTFQTYITYNPSFGVMNPDRLGDIYYDIGCLMGRTRPTIDIKYGPDEEKTYKILTTIKEVKRVLQKLGKSKKPLVCDTESENVSKFNNNILTIQFYNGGPYGYCIPWNHSETPFSQKDQKKIVKYLQKLFSRASKYPFLVGHNLKFEFTIMLTILGIEIDKPLFDTMVGAYLLDETHTKDDDDQTDAMSSTAGYGLGSQLLFYGFHDDWYYQAKSNRAHLSDESLDYVARYGVGDVVLNWELLRCQFEEAKNQNYLQAWKNLILNFYTHQIKLFADLEINGILVDTEYLGVLMSPEKSPLIAYIKEMKKKLYKMPNVKKANKKLNQTQRSVFGDVWMFDIQKPEHKQLLFIDVMGLEPLKYGKSKGGKKGAPSLDKDFQKHYMDEYEEVEILFYLSRANQLFNLYPKSFHEILSKNPDCADGRIRPSFFGTRTRSGRGAARKPNCVDVNSLVNLNGKLIYLKDLFKSYKPKWGGVPTVNLYADTIEGTRDTLTLYNFGEQKTIKLKTSLGFESNTTPNAAQLVINQKTLALEWKFPEDIKIGDYIVFKKGGTWNKEAPDLNFKKFPSKLTKDIAKILGYLVAEGSMGRSVITLGNSNKEVIRDYCSAFIRAFGVKPKLSKRKDKFFIDTEIRSPEIVEYFKYIGYTNYARNATIPWCILQGTKEHAIEFLKAYFEGDGWIDKVARSSAVTYSKTLAKELQTLLMKFGIVSSRHRYGSEQWYIQISSNYHDKFTDEIGFVTKKSSKRSQGWSIIDGVPFLWNILGERNKKKILFKSDNGKIVESNIYSSFKGNCRKDANTCRRDAITNKTIKEIRKISTDLGRNLKALIKIPDLFWDKVTDINDSYAEVADFTMAEGTTKYLEINKGHFIVDGRVQRNTQQTVRGGESDSIDAKLANIIRGLYTSDIGNAILKLDLMANEVRCWGSVSYDKKLKASVLHGRELRIQYFNEGPDEKLKKKVKLEGDIHRTNAAEFNTVPVARVTADQRQGSKDTTFGTIYGLTTGNLAKRLKKTFKETKKIKQQFFSTFRAGKKWLDSMEREGALNLFVESPLGRRRRLWFFLIQYPISKKSSMSQPELNYEDKFVSSRRGQGERRAKNSPIQGIGSDLAFIAAFIVNQYIKKHKKNWKIFNVVHDSLEAEIPVKEIKEYILVTKTIFERMTEKFLKKYFDYDLFIPIEVDYEVGFSLRNMSKWDGAYETLESIQKKMIKLTKNRKPTQDISELQIAA